MAVNVSGNDIAHSGFAQRVSRARVAARLHPSQLTLELTENVLMGPSTDGRDAGRPARARRRPVDRRLGTGYSSLSYSVVLPIDSLKIDASFVRGMRTAPGEAEVVRHRHARRLAAKSVIAGASRPSRSSTSCA